MTVPAGEDTPQRLSGVRFDASPDAAVARAVPQWIGCQRFIFNAKTSEDGLFTSLHRLEARQYPQTAPWGPVDRQYAHLHDVDVASFLREVPSPVLRIGCERWFVAKQRQLKGLARAPRRRNRLNFNSVLLSSELFRFKTVTRREGARNVERTVIELGTEASPVGLLHFRAHRPYGVPKQICIRVVGRGRHDRWSVSFNYAQALTAEELPRSQAELAYELDALGDAALAAITLGVDRNVRENCIATSDGRFFDFSPVQKERMERKRKGAQAYQRRHARCQKGSANSRKLQARIAKKLRYPREVRRDFSHQTSHRLVRQPMQAAPVVAEATATVASITASVPRVIGLEALPVKAMTKAPAPRPDEERRGRYRKNGARAKAGLNRKILSSCWGEIARQVQYKGERANTFVVRTPPAYSSQQCSACGHTAPQNRNASRFSCVACGLTLHADVNAAVNHAARAIKLIRSGELQREKPKKKAGLPKRGKARPTGQQSGREAPEVPVRAVLENRATSPASPRARGPRVRPPTAGSSHRKARRTADPQDAPTTAPEGA